MGLASGITAVARKTPPYEAYPAWTTAKFWGFIRSALRMAHVKWPPAQAVMKSGRRRNTTGKGRHKWEHRCEHCDEWHPQPNIQKDHRIPVGALTCAEELPGFVTRMFVDANGYRKLCKPCHQIVTNEERKRK